MDVFISYEHQSKSIADNICAVLESRGIRCWYAPRDVYGDYATSIVEAIEQCRVFVLVLNSNSSESPHVLNEVEMAYKRILNGEITIVPFKVDEGILSKAMEYYVKRLHWIDAVSAPLEQAINQLYDQLVPILGITKQAPLTSEPIDTNLDRKTVQYYSPEDIVEVSRLHLEEEFLYDFEKPYYDKLMFGKKHLNVLDFGTLNPKSSVHRLKRAEVDKVLCLAYNEQMVVEGNHLYGQDDTVKFYHYDTGESNLDEVLRNAMQDMGIEKFDFINCTMAIMDLQNPFKILKKIRNYLAPNGVAYVRDVDDGVVFAYPDDEGLFETFKQYYKLDSMSGSRHSARQIYSYMKRLGAKEVKLERCGINTSTLNYNQKRMLFDCWFSFIPNDFRQILAKNPNDERVGEIVNWIDEYYDDLEINFFRDDFLFNSGYVIFTVIF